MEVNDVRVKKSLMYSCAMQCQLEYRWRKVKLEYNRLQRGNITCKLRKRVFFAKVNPLSFVYILQLILKYAELRRRLEQTTLDPAGKLVLRQENSALSSQVSNLTSQWAFLIHFKNVTKNGPDTAIRSYNVSHTF